jgi:hypothetical protein
MVERMRAAFSTTLVLSSFVLLAAALVGCDSDQPSAKKPGQAAKPQAAAKKVEMGKNVFFETQGNERRVLVNAYVCLRQGQLEQLLTRKRTKEHEAILAADVDARNIHFALTAAKAEAGKPVQFRPKFQAPTGTTIKVSLEYKDKDGKLVRVPAQQWVRHVKTKKDLPYDWVFAGSHLFNDPLDKTRPPFYAANDGDVICVANFETAMLDLPVDSSKDNDDLAYEAHTERIPPLETPVLLILEPVLKK